MGGKVVDGNGKIQDPSSKIVRTLVHKITIKHKKYVTYFYNIKNPLPIFFLENITFPPWILNPCVFE